MKGVMIVIVLAALCACTSHTRYYTTDGTRVTEIERTTHIGSTPDHKTPGDQQVAPTVCPETQGEHTGSPLQNATQTPGEHVGADLRVCPETQDIP